MRLRDLLKDVEVVEWATSPELEIGGVSYDSRQTQTDDVFVAVTGFASDGHRFIPMAAEKGAATVVCQTKPETEIPYVRVADSRLALAQCSCNFFGDPASQMVMVGITGTNGKTTCAKLIAHVLESCLGAKVGLIGTTGNSIGGEFLPSERTTPESYELQKLLRRMADAGCTHVVMEVSSHALCLHRVAGITYDVGLFTNLTQDHLDFHGTMEAYAAAKAMLLTRCRRAVLNRDDTWYPFMKERAACPVTSYSLNDNAAGVVGKDMRLLPDRVRFCAVTGDGLAPVRLGIPGQFTVYNALGVIACCQALGIPPEDCAATLETARGVTGRMESVPVDGDYTILIDYAHTPDALENVLLAVRETAPGRVVVLFGCGGDRDRIKRPIMGKIGTELSDFAIITSDNPRTEPPEAIIGDILAGVEVKKNRYTVIPDRERAIEWAIEHHVPGDVIVLAGKGHETYQEIGHVKRHMDEREIVAEILEKRKNK